jgi:ATP synthase protein I
MPDTDKPDSRESLEARITEAQRRRSGGSGGPQPAGDMSGSAMGVAMRIGIELVAALAVGTGIGWALDRWLGTRPWLTVAFFFLGAGGGIWNVVRAASGVGLAVGFNPPAQKGRKTDGEGEG